MAEPRGTSLAILQSQDLKLGDARLAGKSSGQSVAEADPDR
jgi:hypothetical protein